MNETQILDIARDGVWTLIMISGPLLLVGLAAGMVIALFQTLTSIQEATLTFVPKMLLIFGCLIIFLPFMIRQITEFTLRTMDVIVGLP